MEIIDEFKSPDADSFFEMFPIGVFFDADDFAVLKLCREISFLDYPPCFDDASQRGNPFSMLCLKYYDSFFGIRNICRLNELELGLANLGVLSKDGEIHGCMVEG